MSSHSPGAAFLEDRFRLAAWFTTRLKAASLAADADITGSGLPADSGEEPG